MKLPPNTPGAEFLDLTSLVDMREAREILTAPEVGSRTLELAIGLTTDKAMPETPLELALGEYYKVDTDDDDFPRLSFKLGDVSSSLMKKYSWHSNPILLIAKVNFDQVDSTTVEYTLPSAASGHRRKAVWRSYVYTSGNVTQGKNTTMKLKRQAQGSAPKIVDPHEWHQEPESTDPTKIRANDYHAVRMAGRLGTTG